MTHWGECARTGPPARPGQPVPPGEALPERPTLALETHEISDDVEQEDGGGREADLHRVRDHGHASHKEMQEASPPTRLRKGNWPLREALRGGGLVQFLRAVKMA